MPNSVTPFDITSHVNLLSTYNAAQTSFGNDEAKNVLANLGAQIAALKDATGTYKTNVNLTLRQQKTVNDILREENNRLQYKEDNIKSAIQGQKRIINLNNSYSKRVAAYTQIVMFAVIAFTIMIIATLMKRRFPAMSDSVVNIVYILMISAVVIYTVYGFMLIRSRELTDFDKLNLPAPASAIQETKDERIKRLNLMIAEGKLSKLAFDPNKLCLPGSEWDSSNSTCKVSTKTGTDCDNGVCCDPTYTTVDTNGKCMPKPEYDYTTE
jgi:ABC-type multidrug transport system fused ATPase/permease subunit